MPIIRFASTTIQSIDQAGIRFTDDQGNQQFIDFAICRTNWLRHINRTLDEMSPKSADWHQRCVGRRNIIGTPPYIEFLTDPPTRFEFDSGQPNQDDYRAMRTQLEHAGCTTFDES
jgi:hypothetical protein